MLALLWSACVALAMWPPPASRVIQTHDNLRSAGRLEGNVLTVRLMADVGSWQPDGPKSKTLEVLAFGEDGAELSVPGPLIRVRQGTTIVITVRNALGSDLRVNGLCSRPGPCAPMLLAAGTSRDVRFDLNTPGTFYYWGSTGPEPLNLRQARDSQLGGAIIVDPRDGSEPDKVFVISIFSAPRLAAARGPDPTVFAINGRSWPLTERLHYEVGDRIRWRVINLSFDQHAMHLHGFHFTLESTGDGNVDRPLATNERRTEVTEQIASGRSFTMSWTPTRAGRWLFHCHMVAHMSARVEATHSGHGAADEDAGMAGLVLGIDVTGMDAAASAPMRAAPRQLSLVMTEEPKRYGNMSGFRMDLEGIDAPRLDAGPVPGPVLVLERGAPVEVTIVNRMSQPTAIHWHGIELDSYFDGVPGWSGRAGSVTPSVAPGQSFVARFTPPRAGTFIYHTHSHDEQQLAGGLYGPLIVLEPGDRYDPAVDHIVVIGLNGVDDPTAREPFALNGRADPGPIRMRTGVPNRLRLINITGNNVALTAFLLDQFELSTWKPVAKDGAMLPAEQTAPRPARQLVSVGETYDFEVQPTRPLWLEVRRGSGEWVLQAKVDLIR